MQRLKRSWDRWTTWLKFLRVCSRFFLDGQLMGIFITKHQGIDITQMDAHNAGITKAFIDKATQGRMKNVPMNIFRHKPIHPRFGA